MRLPLVCLLAAVAASGAPAARTHLEDYALILQDEPLARQIHSRAELRSSAAQQKLQTIVAAQNGLKNELARRHVTVAGSTQLLLNAVYVRIPPDRVSELRALPGVKTVAPLPRIHRHMDQAVQLMGIPDAWNTVGGVGSAGAGVKIGILDTGIDQTHAAFQDPAVSAPAGFPIGDSNFTNGKVIVARSYIAALAQANGTVDDLSPRDHSGHGTAVAMIAAGAPNQGPIATITGIAPKAWLGSYKIFGTPGVNDDPGPAIPMALDDAFRDGMDIVLLPFGGEPIYPALAQDCNGICDSYYFPIEQAVKNAMAHMTVVVSAGNDGNLGTVQPTLSTINTPGIVPDVITVGATSNAHVFFSTLQVNGLPNINALLGGDEPTPAAAVTGPLQDVSQVGSDGFACAQLAAGSLSGSIALVQRGNCSYDVKVNNAQAAGAVGVIVMQSAGNDIPVPMEGMMDTGIPSAMIGYSDGNALKTLLQASPGAAATLDPTLQPQPVSSGSVMFYSSRGPTHGDSAAGLALKPDLVAAGDRIYTATQSSDPGGDLYNATGYTAVGGSSFAAAIVAGAAALVKQVNQSFTPQQIKSALVNTATQDVTDGSDTARVTAVGAGRLNAAAAVSAGATVTPATLSFGAIGGSLTLSLTNTSGAAGTFALAAAPRDTSSPQVNVVPGSVTLNPGETRQVAVQLPAQRPAPGSYEGFVTIGTGAATLHVPYLYLAGDGQPFNITAIRQGSFTSVISDPLFWFLGFKLTDRYGVPVTNYPVFFHVVKGGGVISPDPANGFAADANTDKTGVAGAWIRFGSAAGDQIFNATAGPLTVEFDGYAFPAPNITSVVDAASGQPPTPGATAQISGSSLSNATRQLSSGTPVVQFGGVSVNFSAPGINLPGLISSVSGGQITVQIPSGLAGVSSATVTVINAGIASKAFTVRLANQ